MKPEFSNDYASDLIQKIIFDPHFCAADKEIAEWLQKEQPGKWACFDSIAGIVPASIPADGYVNLADTARADLIAWLQEKSNV